LVEGTLLLYLHKVDGLSKKKSGKLTYMKFEIYIGKDNFYHWRLKAANGEIVCWSEGYSSLENAKKSVSWTRLNAPRAPLM
jgi:uncharacterized protein YegP (UPF0339 family)